MDTLMDTLVTHYGHVYGHTMDNMKECHHRHGWSCGELPVLYWEDTGTTCTARLRATRTEDAREGFKVRGVAKSDGTGAGTAGRCPVPEFHQIGGILDFSAPIFPLFGGIPTPADAPLVPVFGEL